MTILAINKFELVKKMVKTAYLCFARREWESEILDPWNQGGGGVTCLYILGCAAILGPFFAKNPKIWVPTMMGLIFKIFANLVCFCSKMNGKKWVFFYRKIPYFGYLFLEKLPPNMGMGLERRIPNQSKSEYPPHAWNWIMLQLHV